MATYGGDEVSALVIDVGTCWTKAGYAGEDAPKTVFPSFVGVTETQQNGNIEENRDESMTDAGTGESLDQQSSSKKTLKYHVGDSDFSCWRENMDVKNPLKDGLVEDWEVLEEIWNHAFLDRLRVNPEEHPLLVTEASWNTREIREKIAELAFEKYNFPAFFICKNAVLSAFASGKPTALVLDSGGGMTSAVPVYDGYVLKKGILKQNIGGEFISDQILHDFKANKGVEINPHYLINKKSPVEAGEPAQVELKNRPNTNPNYHYQMQMRAINEYKESVCQVFENIYDENTVGTRPLKSFEFPDGYNNQFGTERFALPEIMFQPPRFIVKQSLFDINECQGVSQLIYNSISNCDVDVRPHLFNNIVLSGGNTLYPGFSDRVNFELYNLAPASKIKIHAAGNSVERKYSNWIGGSILASLGTFHQLWVSKKEYEESGGSIIEKKCQ
ncbi:Actin/actin-like protein [Basidiobolus meristosporus CBS 931.73]|uniref:Actin/actin-like protein n=1 Tax=Basidiobolus meristosporus CBS 931.73 TaxID=1314790 RepID=A0A1Y1Z220_9FUNG|nr:Actin/actin-like protein [Basidiobolus meristosporus CBS 931.73]|eukprot:ORY03885.1 Actin/actin-like protein [Basidiobolus meristosporus CBS 931.73]